MGSHSFDLYYDLSTNPAATIQQAYKTLYDEALREHGYDGYNGTISTTGGMNVVRDAPVSRAVADALMSMRIDKLQKWEACEGIPVLADECVTSRTVTTFVAMPTDVPTRDWDDHDYAGHDRQVKEYWQTAREIGKTQVKPLKGERIAAVYYEEYDRRVYKPTKINIAAVSPATTAYYLRYGNRLAMETGYPTAAAAKKAMREELKKDAHQKLSVVAIKDVATGDAEFTISVPIRVVLEKPTKVAPKVGGYLFYGWAAS